MLIIKFMSLDRLAKERYAKNLQNEMKTYNSITML